MTGRGALNPQIQKIAKSRLGREITLRELRIMAYVDYALKNDRRLDPNRINEEERDALIKWKRAHWLDGGVSADSLEVTKEFYDTIQEILWVGYVNHD